MSYINEALRKAQKEKDAHSVRYGAVGRTGRRGSAPFYRRRLGWGLLGVVFISLAFALYSWLDFRPKKSTATAVVARPLPSAATGGRSVEKAKVLYEKARLFQKEGKLEQAKDLYQQTLRLDPGHVEALNNLGVICLREADYTAAQQNFEKAIRLRPGYVDPFYNMACLYAAKGDIEKSLAYLRKTVSMEGSAREWAKRDTDFRNLWQSPEFQRLVEAGARVTRDK